MEPPSKQKNYMDRFKRIN